MNNIIIVLNQYALQYDMAIQIMVNNIEFTLYLHGKAY